MYIYTIYNSKRTSFEKKNKNYLNKKQKNSNLLLKSIIKNLQYEYKHTIEQHLTHNEPKKKNKK